MAGNVRQPRLTMHGSGIDADLALGTGAKLNTRVSCVPCSLEHVQARRVISALLAITHQAGSWDMDAGERRGDGCAPGWEGCWRSTCTTTVKGGRYGHRICDEHRRDRRACIRTCRVTFPAMGRRCDRVLSPPSVLGCMGAPDRLPTVCPGLSVVALDGGGCSALWLCYAGSGRSLAAREGTVGAIWHPPV